MIPIFRVDSQRPFGILGLHVRQSGHQKLRRLHKQQRVGSRVMRELPRSETTSEGMKKTMPEKIALIKEQLEVQYGVVIEATLPKDVLKAAQEELDTDPSGRAVQQADAILAALGIGASAAMPSVAAVQRAQAPPPPTMPPPPLPLPSDQAEEKLNFANSLDFSGLSSSSSLFEQLAMKSRLTLRNAGRKNSATESTLLDHDTSLGPNEAKQATSKRKSALNEDLSIKRVISKTRASTNFARWGAVQFTIWAVMINCARSSHVRHWVTEGMCGGAVRGWWYSRSLDGRGDVRVRTVGTEHTNP
jgi:hypothetical protein